MKNPFWFTVIEQWKLMGQGEYGLTFPFLVGAIAKTSEQIISEELVQSIFHELIENPVNGYYCEVRWCGDIDEPVASVKKLECIQDVSIGSKFNSEKSKSTSLAFTTDLMSMFNLGCSSNDECLEKLIRLTIEKVTEGRFSKNNGIFTDFTKSDHDFIQEVNLYSQR